MLKFPHKIFLLLPLSKCDSICDKLIIRTSINAVICSKINPEFDGVPTTDFLPLSQHTENIIYHRIAFYQLLRFRNWPTILMTAQIHNEQQQVYNPKQ